MKGEKVMKKTLLKNGNLIDGTTDDIRNNMNILIHDGNIHAVTADMPNDTHDYEVIDCTDKYILPGLIDCHVHLVWDGSPNPQEVIKNQTDEGISLDAYSHAMDTLKLGVTTVRDLGAPRRTVLELRNKIDSGKLVGPTVVCSGPPIVMTGGHVSNLGYESDGKDEVRKNTRKVFKEGADLIKVMATGGIYTEGEEPGSVQLNLDELSAVKEEALKKNKKVSAHADGIEGIMNSLEVGIDTIEHAIYADREALEIMKSQGTYLVPTMKVMRQLATSPYIPEWALVKAKEVIEPHFEMLKQAVDLNVKIATGTDCGSPETPPKLYFDELLIMEEAGMTPMEVIQASTSIAAECIDRDDFGVIEPNKRADILIVDQNPVENLSVLKEEKVILKNGKII